MLGVESVLVFMFHKKQKKNNLLHICAFLKMICFFKVYLTFFIEI